jgi:hypothetical protein
MTSTLLQPLHVSALWHDLEHPSPLKERLHYISGHHWPHYFSLRLPLLTDIYAEANMSPPIDN